MKYCCLTLTIAVAAVLMNTQPAHAIPAFKKHFDAKYVEGSDNPAFVEAVKKAKCNLCHYGKKKKDRNAYGMALSNLLKKADYKSKRVKAEPDVVRKEIFAAFDEVAGMKDSGGTTYGDLFKAGKIPADELAKAKE